MENNVQQPQYQPPVAPEQKPSNGLAIASLVLGILSIIMVFVYRYRACLKCRASAEKILTTGGPTT